jgi:hypothetical protein
VTTAHGLRTPRESGDLDVLLPRAAVDAVAARLRARGWRPRARDTDELIFPAHAVTLYRPGWPVDIDLHHRYHGLPSAPGTAYDRVAPHCERQRIDGIDVLAPRPAAHAVLVALHSLRGAGIARHRAEREELVTALRGMDVEEVLAAARDLGALANARPVLEQCLPAGRTVDWGEPDDDWLLLTAAEAAHLRRAIHLRRAGWRDRVRMVARWLRPSIDDLYKNLDSVQRTRRKTALRFLRRIARGIVLLPLALAQTRQR